MASHNNVSKITFIADSELVSLHSKVFLSAYEVNQGCLGPSVLASSKASSIMNFSG